MATKEAPKTEEPAAEAPPAAKSKKLLFIIIGSVVGAIVIGLVVGKLMFGGKHAAPKEAGDETTVEEVKKVAPKLDPGKPPVYVNLEPFTVNLQPENGDQFLQVVATLRIADEKTGDMIKQYMPQLRHEILSVLSAKRASEITTMDGKEALADEIKEVANEVLGFPPPPPSKKKRKEKVDESGGPVFAVLFTQFIVQ